MRSTRPPKIAKWLLEHFGCSPNNATVIGDLDERYLTGRSSAWYWRQVAVAILVSFAQEVWNHKFHAAIAVFTGWAVLLFATSWLNYFLFLPSNPWLLPTTWMYPEGWLFILTWAMFAAAGWIVATTHLSHRKPMVLMYAMSFLIWAAPHLGVSILKELSGDRPTGAYPISLAVLSLIFDCSGILFGGGLFTNRERAGSRQRTTGGSMYRLLTLTAFVLLILLGSVLQLQAQLSIRAASDEAVTGWDPMQVDNHTVWVSPTISLTSADILRAEPATDANGRRAVGVIFNDGGAKKMSDLSTAQLNKLIAMLLDGKVIFAPKVRSAMGKEALITGPASTGLAPDVVQRIVDSVNRK